MSPALCQVGLKTGVCGVCNPGTFHCDGAKLSSCAKDGQYMMAMGCASAALCNEDVGMCTDMKCTPSAVSCSSDSMTLKTCDATGSAFAEEKPCPEGCNADTKKCNACMPGAKMCMGNGVATCGSDGSAFGAPMDCPNGCNATMNACNTCKPGAKMCMGDGLGECKADGSGFGSPAACQNGCNQTKNACNDCKPGDKMCNGDSLLTCTDGTSFGSPMNCSEGCNDGMGKCNVCKPGAPMCMGDGLATCKSDGTGFGSPMNCNNGCNSSKDTCNTCKPNIKMCMGNGVASCKSDGSGFNSPSPCTDGCNTSKNDCNSCTPGEKQCNGSNLETCASDGSGFGSPKSCGSSGCNSSRMECNTCKPGERKCSNGNTLTTCNSDGTGMTPMTCTSMGECNTGVCDGNACMQSSKGPDVACMNNTGTCDSNGGCKVKPLCGNGKWDTGQGEQCDKSNDAWKNSAFACDDACHITSSIYNACPQGGQPCWNGGPGGWFCSALGACTRTCNTGNCEGGGACVPDPITKGQRLCAPASGCGLGTELQWVGRQGCFMSSSNSSDPCFNAPIPDHTLCGWVSVDPTTKQFWCPGEVSPCCPPVEWGGRLSSNCL